MKPFILFLCGIVFLSTVSISQGKKSIKKGKSSVDSTKGSHGLVVIQTSMGDITIQLADDKAPKHAANFRKLAKEGFYAGTTFHRVIPGFMIQGGDPNSKGDDHLKDGLGGPGYTIDAEIGLTHDRGVIAAARQGDEVNPMRKSNGSQFYICLAPQPSYDGQYTVFGNVVWGMDTLNQISELPVDTNDNPLQRVEIKSIKILPREKLPPPPVPKQDEPMIFLEVDPDQAAPEPPKDAKYYSSKNSRAANPEPDKITETPKIDGKRPEVVKTEDTAREKASIASTESSYFFLSAGSMIE